MKAGHPLSRRGAGCNRSLLSGQELIPGWLKENGITEATYTPPQGYFVAEENPKDFENFEANFPYKEKLKLPRRNAF